MNYIFNSRKRTVVCRHCGREFVTVHRTQKTCKSPECVEWLDDLRREQARARKARFKKLHERES